MDRILCGRCRAQLDQRESRLVCPQCGWNKPIGKQFSQPGTGLVLLESYSTEKVSDGTRDGLLVSRVYVHPDDLPALRRTLGDQKSLDRLLHEFTSALRAAAS